jgi:selenide, water dikinase
MGPRALAQVLCRLKQCVPPEEHPDLIAGLACGDDSAVYRINATTAIIETVDFFPPIVDDPYQYGAIAATNAMSDIYAMGGEVLLALNVCAFPSTLSLETQVEILRGGAEQVRRAGGFLAGGHTVVDSEPKYGLAVTGIVHPDRVFLKRGAMPGDAIVLTKPIGAGLIATALKGGVARPEHVAGAVASMTRLNRRAAQIFQEVGGIHACTDVTGFAVIGHGNELASHGNVRIRLFAGRLPLLDGAASYAEDFLFPAGTYTNREGYEGVVAFEPGIPEEKRLLLLTPETSGGLIAAVSPEKVAELEAAFAAAGAPCWVVGEVVAGSGIEVIHG